MNRLFWDIETSLGLYWAWRCGSKVNLTHDSIYLEPQIICICYKWEKCDTVYSMRWNCKGPLEWDDSEMVKKFRNVIKGADEIVAHNGNKFDMKWFKMRCLMADAGPFPPIVQVDTLKMVRKEFGFQSNRLDYLDKRRGGSGKTKTEFELWKKVCLGDKKAEQYMIDYCKKDVIALQEFYEWIIPYCKDESHAGAVLGKGKWTCPHDGSENVVGGGSRHTATGVKQWKMKCNDCHKYYTISDKSHRDFIEAKYEDK